MKPRFLRNINEEYEIATLEEMHIRRKLLSAMKDESDSFQNLNSAGQSNGRSRSLPSLGIEIAQAELQVNANHIWSTLTKRNNLLSSKTNGVEKKTTSPKVHQLQVALSEAEEKRKGLEYQKKASAFRRNLGYPLAMLILACLTFVAALLVVQNTLELLVGIKALPLSSAQQFSLGITSLSKLGLLGSTLEITLILYLWNASVVGLYSLPLIRHLRPRMGDTSFTQIIGNCALLLVLSSALPVLARTVGITNFDLLGDFGRIEWLGNFYVVFFYNTLFATTTAFSLTTTFTVAVRKELFKRLQVVGNWFTFNQTEHKGSTTPSALGLNGSPFAAHVNLYKYE